ncbi:hypothetical protein CMUS01_03036 [Colletotrichum musicola]|uniref:Uncharacterized protein n=1 Tax=Colletotrichum musicola TaxID=2175873 RepID=A0A8H6NUB1_9PEZI|nr:hypothetical protein CMUS01_03036 [Colletotrichum musicola]
MNGTQQTQDVAAQQPLQPATANANGSSTAAKKRKKEGLKPIITTDTPPESVLQQQFSSVPSSTSVPPPAQSPGPRRADCPAPGHLELPRQCGEMERIRRCIRTATTKKGYEKPKEERELSRNRPPTQPLGNTTGSVTRLGGGRIRCWCRTQADGEISVLARERKTRANEGCPSTDFTGRQLSSSCQDLGMNTYDAPCSARATDVLMYGRRRRRDGWYRGLILSPEDLLGALLILGAGAGGPDFASPDHSFSFPSLFSSSHLLRVAPAPPSSLSSFLRHHRPGRLAATLLCAAVRFWKSPYGVAQRHLILRCGAVHCGALPLAGWLRAIQRDARQGKATHATLP